MKTKVATFLLFAFYPVCIALAQQTTEFILIKQDKNINIYAKWIKVDETRSARQLKAEFTVNASFTKIISLKE